MIAFHLIISAYGFWLPNDPRGSWSDFVGSWELLRFGPATKTLETRSLAHDPHDVTLRRAAKLALKYPPVRFNGAQRQTIAHGFQQAVDFAGYQISACCIGYDHAHLVIARHERTIPAIAAQLKSCATRALTNANLHPLQTRTNKRGGPPTPWSEGCWKVFIDKPEQFQQAIRYVERHPEKEGLPRQNWDFVTADAR